MKKKTLISISAFLSLISLTVCSQNVYQTAVYEPNIKTLRLKYDNSEHLERPILWLGDDQTIEISFDELSHSAHQYSYDIRHLNADWTESDLLESDYLLGSQMNDITDFDYSVNTQQLYTHYRFQFPNEDVSVSQSGNYVIVIYEDADREKVVATACFCVAENRVGIEANLRANTQIELSGRYQQLDIDVVTNDLQWRDASDFKLVVKQNNRNDNAVVATKPTYIESKKLRYVDRKELIFEGGNEFRRFDISSEYIKGYNVDKIIFDNRYYHAFLFEDQNLSQSPYTKELDSDGQFVINAERRDDDDFEADYMWVNFFLPQASPFFDGKIFVCGDLTYNQLSEAAQMNYDNEHKTYFLSLYLKQGGYDYQYLFLPKGKQQLTSFRTEGSHWQTENEYTIYVYYRPFGARADRLVGVKKL